MKPYLGRIMLAPALGCLALSLLSPALHAQYRQQNLVSDLPGLAPNTDPHLVNPWGISAGPTSPFWVSNEGDGTSTLYNTAGHPLPLVVTIPGGAPTGQVFNSTTAFNGDRFIFAGGDGTISGWRGALGTTAEVLSGPHDGAIYTGIALGSIGADTYLYAADFHNARIDVVPSAGAPALLGSFTDPTLPAGYSPFNVQNLGGSLYVAYAKSDGSGEEIPGAGNGFVSQYDLNGNLLMRVASNGPLNAPWGVALAPASFGQFGGGLLVGNLGDGTINAFDPVSGDLLGTLKDSHGNPIAIEGLWGLQFGNGGAGGKLGTLYFAAGIEDETHGLFGSLVPVPEPSTYALFAALGLVGIIAFRRFRGAGAAAA